MIHPLWHAYPVIYRQLQQVQTLLADRTHCRVPAVDARIQAQVHAGGKMLRAGSLLLFARFGQADAHEERQLIHAAAAIETLHLATLVHDDVLDQAATRRGEATVADAVGNRAAIYAGDFLFSVYFELLAEVAPDVGNVSVNAQAMRRIFLGELDQNGPVPGAMTLHRYLRQIGGKTAALFKLACYQGALLGECLPRQQHAAASFGYYLGMGFQMQDDVLDVAGNPQKMRKPAFEDLHNGIVNLPHLCALAVDDGTLKQYLAAGDLTHAAQVIKETGVAPAQALANRYIDKALTSLQQLPDTPTRLALETLTRRQAGRKD
ncbi:polyprenyl synthetase family protein [Lacticaseibacillus baoqingensis]|uniref:Polyprenyl synthetase family protein n=1 Tax=Lacticaseibacillus baoqingensis TaxID=2486013 RepID=A0ABW4EB87_9LACO|nr:polyprenyl synthetase family protein [Lacticaseibacillus baoqingensis]